MTYWVGFRDEMRMGCTGLLWNFCECVIGQLDIFRGQTRPSLDRCKWVKWVWPFWRSVMVAVEDAERLVSWY